jgi:sugar phosphate permease
LASFLLARFGWRVAFSGPALWLLVMSAIVFLLLRPGPLLAAAGTDLQLNQSLPPPSRSASGALGNRILYCYGACYFCLKLIRYSLLFWLPFYLHTVAGFGEAQSGYLSTSFELGGVLGSAGLGWISDRTGREHARTALFSLLGLAGALLAYAQIGAAAGPALHFAALALVGALLFGPDALLSGAAAQDAGGPEQAATATGLVNGIGSVGALLQGPLTVSVQSALGWHALFYVFLALSLISCACLLPALRVRRS